MEPLMSERHAPLQHHARSKCHQPLGGLIVRDKTAPKAPVHLPKEPFRLLHLPVEIQCLVYEHYFGHWEVTLENERITMLRTKFHVHGVPTLDLLLTCKAIHREAQSIRMNTFNGRLNLNNVFVLISLRQKPRFDWLKQNVRTLHFSDSSVHPERWNRYYDNFPNLSKLEIDFPHIIQLDIRCRNLDSVLNGKHDAVLLESLDTFRLTLVDQLSDMVRVVVSQRYRLTESIGGWRGVLDVRIELARGCTRVIARCHDNGVNVLSKRQFRGVAEV